MDQPPDGLRFFRNRLPQWRQDGGIYFVTWNLQDINDELTPAERTIVATALKQFHRVRYDLAIFVVMDDHVHVLVQMRRGFDLGKTAKTWKGYTARAINQLRRASGTRWQKDSHTELLDHPAAIESRREYIARNPVSRWGKLGVDYPWLECFE